MAQILYKLTLALLFIHELVLHSSIYIYIYAYYVYYVPETSKCLGCAVVNDSALGVYNVKRSADIE